MQQRSSGTPPRPAFIVGRRRAALLAACAVASCAADANEFRRVAVGDPAPDYAAADLAGDTVRLADFRGDVVLLNVWATWCAPCRREMPELQALQERFAERGFHVLGVSIDARGAESAIRTFTDDLGVGFRILHDPDERVARTFRTIGVPESFLIGRDGVIAARWIGSFDPIAEETLATVREALASGAAGR
jgi:peroxiredoxin